MSPSLLITLQGAPAEVTWLAREYACVCCIIKMQRNAGVGLVKQLVHEKGLSVRWSTRVQRLHIVSLASIGLLYCPSFSHLPCTATHQSGGRKWLFIDSSVGACTGTQWRGESVSWLQLPFMILSHSPATSNLHECYRVTHYPQPLHEAVGRVQKTNHSAAMSARFIVVV